MKKLVTSALICCMVAALAACSSSNDATTSTPPTESATTESATQEAPVSETAEDSAPSDSGTLGDYTVSIKDAVQTTDYEGNPALIINFDFTNNATEAQAFAFVTDTTAFQDGVELEMAIISSDSYNGDAQMKQIQPGITLPVQVAYSLTSQNPVTVEVTELISFDDAKLVKEFTLS